MPEQHRLWQQLPVQQHAGQLHVQLPAGVRGRPVRGVPGRGRVQRAPAAVRARRQVHQRPGRLPVPLPRGIHRRPQHQRMPAGARASAE